MIAKDFGQGDRSVVAFLPPVSFLEDGSLEYNIVPDRWNVVRGW